ncbi:hypothetical protein JXJ21_13215 [candidate division KSB1 bacterium]|nr:hypothetical protein [candidate division KSB1 bacterium]
MKSKTSVIRDCHGSPAPKLKPGSQKVRLYDEKEYFPADVIIDRFYQG